MKRFLNVFCIIVTIFDIVEFLFLPVVFLFLGIWNRLPWQYYVIFIGGYFVLFAIVELLLTLIFNKLEKKYTPFLIRKFKKRWSEFDKNRE